MSKRPEKETKIAGPIKEKDFNRHKKPLPIPRELYVDRLIREAEAEGKFSNLANEGKPLKVKPENPYVPEDMRLAYQVLEEAGYSPPWMELEKEVNAELAKVSREREDHHRYLRRRLDEIKTGPFQYFFRDLRRLAESHEFWLKAHAEKLTGLNQKIHAFNHQCPVPQLLKAPLQVEQIITEYDKSCPAIPKM